MRQAVPLVMPLSSRTRLPALALLILGPLVVGSCDRDPSGPEQGYTIRIQSGDAQFGGFGAPLESPLQVVVEDAVTGDPAAGVVVRWSVASGGGALLGAATTPTNANGLASTTLRLGPSDESYEVRATVDRLVGPAVVFDATAVPPAHIDSVAPAQADAGDTITIYGSAFAISADDNTVLIAGLRAVVLEASATRLRVVVPLCAPSRVAADVRVFLGSVESNGATLDVTGMSGGGTVTMAVGEVLQLADVAAASCLRLPAIAGLRYLLVLQNATPTAGQDLHFRLSGATGESPMASGYRGRAATTGSRARQAVSSAAQAGVQRQADLDAGLREAERILLEGGAEVGPVRAPARAAPRVEIGDRRQFWVFRSSGNYVRITAEVRHVSEHAILYQDLEAPEGGFEAADFEAFGDVFDDPIYETMTGVFGVPSDVDENGRIIILFTPVVNRMTPPSSGSAFVAGFFFGIDLLSGQSRGNNSEVFYTLVPDPEGEFGNVRTFQQILQGVPPVMAHEFQHMIHFNQRVLLRDASLEATWLSEGLAHAAEELVGDAYLARGDADRAFDFKIQNFLRAELFMEDPAAVSPLGPAAPLPVRGAAWLLLEYLQGHFGGSALLTELTQTTASSVANITARTGLSWGTVLSRWGTAIWADDAGIPGVDPVYTFPEVDLRAVYSSVGFPLQPATLTFTDFTRTGTLSAAGSTYWLLEAGTSAAPLNVAVAGRNAPFGASDRPQLTVLRIE